MREHEVHPVDRPDEHLDRLVLRRGHLHALRRLRHGHAVVTLLVGVGREPGAHRGHARTRYDGSILVGDDALQYPRLRRGTQDERPTRERREEGLEQAAWTHRGGFQEVRGGARANILATDFRLGAAYAKTRGMTRSRRR